MIPALLFSPPYLNLIWPLLNIEIKHQYETISVKQYERYHLKKKTSGIFNNENDLKNCLNEYLYKIGCVIFL